MRISPEVQFFSETNADVDNGALEDVTSEIVVSGKGRVAFQVKNTTAAVALQDFALLGKFSPGADWVSLITGTAWTAVIAGLLPYVSTDLNTLAGEGTGFARLELGPIYSIKFQARAASGAGNSVTVSGTASAL